MWCRYFGCLRIGHVDDGGAVLLHLAGERVHPQAAVVADVGDEAAALLVDHGLIQAERACRSWAPTRRMSCCSAARAGVGTSPSRPIRRAIRHALTARSPSASRPPPLAAPQPTRGPAGRSIAIPLAEPRRRRAAGYNHGMAEPRSPEFTLRWITTVGNLLGAIVAFVYFRVVDHAGSVLPPVRWIDVVISIIVFALIVGAGIRLSRPWTRPLNRVAELADAAARGGRAGAPSGAHCFPTSSPGSASSAGPWPASSGASSGPSWPASSARTVAAPGLRQHRDRGRRDRRLHLLRERASVAAAPARVLPGGRSERGQARAPARGARPAPRHLPADRRGSARDPRHAGLHARGGPGGRRPGRRRRDRGRPAADHPLPGRGRGRRRDRPRPSSRPTAWRRRCGTWRPRWPRWSGAGSTATPRW